MSLCFGQREDLGLTADTDHVFAIVARLDGSYGLQQGHHRPPLDVVTGRMLEDLQQRVAVMVVEVHGL